MDEKPDERAIRRAELDEVAGRDHPYPGSRFNGRGIVIIGGGPKYFPCAWVCIKMLRHLFCDLPIELWHLGGTEMDDAMRALLVPYDVATVDAHEMRKRSGERNLSGWELKSYAIIQCRFKEVLFLDADNVPVVNPEFLFRIHEFRKYGAIFWPDRSRFKKDREIWGVTGIEYRDEAEFDSGQIVLDKERCWKALQVTMHLNEHSKFYYRLIFGDKDTFRLAWRKLGQEYAMPAKGLLDLRGTMCQHDFSDRRIFQHRSAHKWRLDGQNFQIQGFLYQEECLKFLEQLSKKWRPLDSLRWNAKDRCPMEYAAAVELTSIRYEYHRVGIDRRPMSFNVDGTVEEGARGREVYWDVRLSAGMVRMHVSSPRGRTFSLTKDPDGIWRGRWEIYEKMPVEMVPIGVPLGANASSA